MPVTFADRVKRARRRLGMTMQQLADALHTTKTTIWRWEHGQRLPRNTGIILDRLDTMEANRKD